LLDMTSFGKLEVHGPGAVALLQRLADNDVDRPVGTVVYTQFCNPRGGIESDLTIARLAPDRFRVVTGSAFLASDLGWIRMHLPAGDAPGEAVDVREATDEWACLGLWGPEARHVLQAVTTHDLSNAAFPYMTGRLVDLDGVTAWAQRVTYVGELGWEIYVPRAEAGRAWDVLWLAGRERGIRGVGYKGLDAPRLRKGHRHWGARSAPTRK